MTLDQLTAALDTAGLRYDSERPATPNPELYPDIAQASSLAVALQAELGAGHTAKPETARGWDYLAAKVEDGRRFSHIRMARDVRLFSLDFIEDGWSTGATSPELSEIAAAIHTWHSGATHDELRSAHPFVRLADG